MLLFFCPVLFYPVETVDLLRFRGEQEEYIDHLLRPSTSYTMHGSLNSNNAYSTHRFSQETEKVTNVFENTQHKH